MSAARQPLESGAASMTSVRRWRLWLAWVGMNSIAQGIAAVLVAAFTARLLASIRWHGFAPESAGPMVTPAQLLLTGAIVGVAQWALLRGKFRGARWWVPVTILGALAAAPVQILIDQGFRALLHHKPTPGEVLAWALAIGIAVGLCVAVAQFLVLRRAFAGAAIWLPVSLAGGGVGAFVATGLRILPLTHPFFGLYGGYALGGLLAGGIGAAITGFALWRLLQEGGTPRSMGGPVRAALSPNLDLPIPFTGPTSLPGERHSTISAVRTDP
jgi:hypothetical protein